MRGRKAQFIIEVFIHALFWLGVYYALKALTVTSFQVVDRYNGRPTMNMYGQRLFFYTPVVLWALLLLFYGNVFLLFPRVIRLRSKVLGISIITGWVLLLYGLNYEVIRVLIGPDRRLPDQGNLVPGIPADKPRLPLPPPPSSTDDWRHMQGIMAAVFLSILGIAVAYFLIREWIRNDLRRSQAEAQQLSTEIRFLRSQVNPHFLFNTLNNLFSMAQRRGHEEMADGIAKLSGMMRYMIYESNTDTVPLQREISYLEDCIALNKLRYADNEVAVCLRHPAPTAIEEIQVAPMLLVPFLENAFKHGVSIGHHSDISMAIAVNQKKLTFTCENTDHSAIKKLEEEKGGIGLENVRRRLDLVYPGRYELRAGPEEGKYKVNLQIELA
jgi:two-component system LytT family sensor kinase